MKNLLLIIVFISLSFRGVSQESEKSRSETLLKELAENGCKCVDSISTYNKPKAEVAKEISKCINNQAGAFQMGSKLMEIDKLKENAEVVDGKKQINISINVNQNSDDYKKYYYELERYMFNHCNSLKIKMSANGDYNEKSMSTNPQAIEYYNQAIEESKNENYKNAILFYEKAVGADSTFVYAWDNLGICYRRLKEYDKSINAYKKSLEIYPYGLMPLQNIAIVYQYKKEYSKAIEAYGRLAEIDLNNPEVYYGIGNIYANNLNDYEKGLENMCKAYNIYVDQKSPYRADAEKMINVIFSEMKKQGKEEEFNKILKAYNISHN